MEGIELAFQQLRSLEQALADLRETYKQKPSHSLARMIANAEAEIADRAINLLRGELQLLSQRS